MTVQPFPADQDDVCGERAVGVNLCNSSQTTAASAKVDYVFGEEVRGLGSTGGMGVAW